MAYMFSFHFNSAIHVCMMLAVAAKCSSAGEKSDIYIFNNNIIIRLKNNVSIDVRCNS